METGDTVKYTQWNPYAVKWNPYVVKGIIYCKGIHFYLYGIENKKEPIVTFHKHPIPPHGYITKRVRVLLIERNKY